MTLAEILAKLKARKNSGAVRTGFDYLSNIGTCIGDSRMDKFVQMASLADWEKALSDSQNKLVYVDHGPGVTGGFTRGPNNSAVKFGSPVRKGDEDQVKQGDGKILMTLEYIATSRRRDRDGDVLEPQGARVDPKMPFLWQHMPFEPIGGFIAEVERTEEFLKLSSYIADTRLGYDACTLVELGALRISHGFKPNKYDPIDDQSYGWHVTDYDMMETSLVSIPSNVDAEILAFSRSKLTHPLVKQWCGKLFAERPPIVKSGWESPPTIIVNVNTNPNEGKSMTPEEIKAKADKEAADKAAADKAAADKAAADKAAADLAAKAAADKEAADKAAAEAAAKKKKAKAAAAKLKAGTGLVKGKKKPVRIHKADDDDDEEDEDDDADKEDDDTEEDDSDDEPEESTAALGQLAEYISAAAACADIPKEAAGRLSVLTGMLEDVTAFTGEFAGTVGECGKSLDIAGIFKAVDAYMGDVVDSLTRMAAEVDSVLSVRNLPEAAGEPLGSAREMLETITTAVGAMKGDDSLDANDDGVPPPPSDVGKEDDEDDDDEDGKDFDAIFGEVLKSGELDPAARKKLRRLTCN